MLYDPITKKFDAEPEWFELHSASIQYVQKSTEFTLALVIDVFRRVSTLNELTLTVMPDKQSPQSGLAPQGFTCECEVVLRVAPGTLMLPSANRFVPEVDVVSQFRLRGGLTDEEFENSLSHYFNEVWPGFNDRAHLFGGVGRVTIYRQQIEELLAAQSQVDLKKAVKKVFAGDVSYLDVVTQKPKFNHAQ